MIRGIALEITKKLENLLEIVLEGINVLEYSWYNIESQKEAWSLTAYGEKEFLEHSLYRGGEFKSHISKKHFIIFLKLEAYLEDTKNFDIHTYREFQNSDCKILILIYDCKNIEIYVKDGEVLQSIYESIEGKDCCEIEFITDDNDGRTLFDVI